MRNVQCCGKMLPTLAVMEKFIALPGVAQISLLIQPSEGANPYETRARE